jgi:cell wall-associated NlpC family hydrolase
MLLQNRADCCTTAQRGALAVLAWLLLVALTHCGTAPSVRRLTREPIDPGALIGTARAQLGAPYRAGGTSPQTGFDCSGFTSWVFVQHGLILPRQSFDQFRVGEEVRQRSLRPGDLVFFEIDRKGASHVGLYSGRGKFVHCSSTGGRVREDPLTEKYWQRHYLGARRILE